MPVGTDPERWRTFPGGRLVVAVARTVTSTVRVLDVLRPVLRDDARVDLVFAYDPTSAFSDGVRELLSSAGARVMPWKQLRSAAPDLIVTATENADLSETDPSTPVLVLPHGVGFHKHVPDSRGTEERLAGVVPESLLRTDRVRLAVSHPEQEAQLAAAQPSTRGRTVLIGDPCDDGLLNGAPLRAAYRRALGLGEPSVDSRRLVMLSSTWRASSVLGDDPALPARLLASLPMDEYVVALVTHPNVLSAHGELQLSITLDAAEAGGLLRIPVTEGWQATLLASDLVIGDHGSVTFYAAAHGKPVLLGAFGAKEAVRGTPMEELGRTAPRLDRRAPLCEQVERAIAEHEPERYRRLGERAFSVPGSALERLREEVYSLIGLSPPAERCTPRPVPTTPAPTNTVGHGTARLVTAQLSGPIGAERISLHRIPAAVAHLATDASDPRHGPVPGTVEATDGPRTEPGDTPATTGPADRTHGPTEPRATYRLLCCADDERDRRLSESASALVRRHTADTGTAAARWIQKTLVSFPGCRLAAAPVRGRGCRVGLADGRSVEAIATGPELDPGVLATIVYTCLRGGVPLDGIVGLSLGGRCEDVDLRTLPS